MIPGYDEWKTTPPDNPKPIAYCDICGEPIYEGDAVIDYFELSHEECFTERYKRIM